jgi:hypothetical protein
MQAIKLNFHLGNKLHLFTTWTMDYILNYKFGVNEFHLKPQLICDLLDYFTGGAYMSYSLVFS